MTQLGWVGALRTASTKGLGWLGRGDDEEAVAHHEMPVSRETTSGESVRGVLLAAHEEVPLQREALMGVESPGEAASVSRETTSGADDGGVESDIGAAAALKTMPVPAGVSPSAVPVLTEGGSHEGVIDVDIDLRDVPRETSRAVVREQFPRPVETRILTIANQKGGVGKTTTAVNIASALSAGGLKVLVLDMDPQGNASTALGIEHHADVPGIYEVLVDGKPLTEVVQRCAEAPDLWCAPATVDLAGAEIELVSMVARESRLQRALTRYLKTVERNGEGRVDYVLIDCPPSLGLLTINAFVAAPEVLIPIQCEYYALEGLSQLLANIELIQEHLNPDLVVSTILLTMYDGRTRLAAQVVDEVRQHFGEQVVRALVPRSVRISEAPSHGQTVMAYDPSSSGALAYLEAAREIAHRGETLVDLVEPAPSVVGAPAASSDPWARWTDGTGSRRGVASREGGA